MDDVLVIGAGPAGLLAAWVARQRGAQARVMATGIGTTHVSPGWVRVWNGHVLPAWGGASLQRWIATHPDHPYALAGLDALQGGLVALREISKAAGIHYIGELDSNLLLPTALGTTMPAAVVPESFAAGDLQTSGPMLIAGPAGWRDFYPKLCADNLSRAGYPARGVTFELPEIHVSSQFDATPVGLARLFERAEIRQKVAAQLKPQLDGATRVGLPAVLGLEQATEVWRDLSHRLGVALFEIPTLPPSVPGIRLFNALKAGLTQAGVPILLDMTAVRGLVEGNRATGVVVPNVVRDVIYRAGTIILATGGLYGGGITSDYTGTLREAVFGLSLHVPGEMGDWFNERLLPSPVETLHVEDPRQGATSLQGHRIHLAGVRANAQMQPVDEAGKVVLENIRIAGRLLAGYDPFSEGSTEGVWLATAFCAARPLA